jgi:hypothetical protein
MRPYARRRRAREIARDITVFPMRPGEPMAQEPRDAVLKVVGHGPLAYIWVGNESGACFATLDGAGLRRLVGRFRRRHRTPTAAKDGSPDGRRAGRGD